MLSLLCQTPNGGYYVIFPGFITQRPQCTPIPVSSPEREVELQL